MYYYKRNIGDYAAKAGHLSPLEHGVYTLLLDAYYHREEAPTRADAIRWARARTQDEVAAVDAVLSEFFTESEGRYRQQRVEDELRAYREKALVNREIAIKREQAKRERTKHDRSTERAQDVHESCLKREPNQEPVTKNQHRSKELASPIGEESASTRTDCPHGEIIAAYHDALPELPAVRVWTDQRRKHLQARWRESPERQSVAWWRAFFGYVRGCPWLMGDGSPSPGRQVFRADLGWLLRPENFAKVIEGRYQRQEAA